MSRRRRRTAALAAVLVAVAVLASGCVRLPVSGPVVAESGETSRTTMPGTYYVPSGPQPGESPTDIVRHFMEAMTATPLQTGVAREFLTDDAAAAWEPDRETVTYAGALRPTGGTEVRLRLPEANRLDRGGTWLGELAGPSSVLGFPMARVEGEWRIADAPDALVVPETWFEDRFRPVSLYFFDPEAEILVPEPVFVPDGEQLATTLVRRLLDGPRVRGVSRTFLPPDASLGLSVTVSRTGLAEVALQGGGRSVADPEVASLLLTQLGWTLRQDPTIESFRLLVGGEPVRLPDGASQVPVDVGGEYAPWVSASSSRLFGILDGAVVDVSPGEGTAPVAGPLGSGDVAVREIAVDMAGDRLAAVEEDGTSIVTGAVDDDGTDVRTVVSGGEDLGKPSWDHLGRLWTLDRTADGARVSLVPGGGGVRELFVPGVTGLDVKRMIVSRDGSRLVTVVRGPRGDRVQVNRIRYGEDGRVSRPTAPRVVFEGSEEPVRVVDVAWSSPTSLDVVDSTQRIWSVTDVPVDGSGANADDQTPLALDRTPVWRVASAPEDGLPAFVVTADGAEVLGSLRSTEDEIDPRVRGLTYVG